MSTIDKLVIQGVRAFDPGVQEWISFSVPLTLIVGHNGAGKTTIIEALKYSTTGLLPPGSKGVEFIHDPTLHGEREISAQLKLQLRNSEGATIIGTRSMKVGFKSGKLSYNATSNNSILEVRDGQKNTRNLTLGAMDVQMAKHLGVSPAVLDRVIFCHQDESLWPMAEANQVKKQFDELFELKRYADVIANLDTLHRKQDEELKQHAKDVEYLKRTRDDGRGADRRCKELAEEVDELVSRSNDLGPQLETIEQDRQAAQKRADGAFAIVGKLRNKRDAAENMHKQIEVIGENMEELDEDDADLESMLQQYEEHIAKRRQAAKDAKDNQLSLDRDTKDAQNKQRELEREIGSGKAAQDMYERQLKSRSKLARKIAQDYNLREYDTDLEDDKMREFMDRMTEVVHEKSLAVHNAKEEASAARQLIQTDIDSIKETRTMLGSRKDNARAQIKNNNSTIARLQQEHDSIEVDEGARYTREANLHSIQQQLDTARASAQEADYDAKVHNLKVELDRLNTALQMVSEERNRATEHNSDTVQLEKAQEDLREAQQRSNVMNATHKANITTVLQSEWTPANVRQVFDDKEKQEAMALQGQEQEDKRLTDQLANINKQLQEFKAELKGKDAALKAAEAAINDVILAGPVGYEEELAKLEEIQTQLQSEADSCDVLRRLIDQQLKDAERKPTGVCRTCTRAITKEKELENLKRNLDREKGRLDLSSITKELTTAKEALSQAKAVRSQVELWRHLSETAVPALKTKISQLEQERILLVERLAAHDGVIDEHQSKKRDVDSMSKLVKSIADDHDNISKYEKIIAGLSDKLRSVGMSRGLKQINDEQDKITGDLKDATARLERLRSEQGRSSEKVNLLDRQVRDAQSELSSADRDLKKKAERAKEIERLKADSTQQKTTEHTCDEQLGMKNLELHQAQDRLNDAVIDATATEERLRSEAAKIESSFSQLKGVTREIQTYLDRDGPAKLKFAEESVTECTEALKNLAQESHELKQALDKLEYELQDEDKTRRNIRANLTWRQQTQALARIREEIQELEQRDDDAEVRRFTALAQELNEEWSKLRDEQRVCDTKIGVKQDQLAEQVNDYEQKYKNSALKYREAHVKYETTKACRDDLKEYRAALDQAIMKFHALKMSEINRTIDELWRKTYQGTDVDTIYITSDAEGGNGKSYNYRVCMQKQQTEMDMRGRCSAGQKVLACIIIRLALAECFGINCGLIALDEPTTNLDRENIEALATALAELIRVRRAQKNFQLIIITHDEDFLKHMNPSDYVDYYYRVSRNSKQKSQIKQEQISYLMRH